MSIIHILNVHVLDRFKEYDENHEVDLNLKSIVNLILLRLNSLLEYLVEFYPDQFLPYVRALGKKLQEIIVENQSSKLVFSILRNFRLKPEESKLPLLDFFRLLQSKMIEVIKISLNLKKYYGDRYKRKLKITQFDRTRGRIIPQYLMVKVLAEIMPREEALEFYKEFLDYTFTNTKFTGSSVRMVTEMLERSEREFKFTHVFTSFRITQGKAGVKVEKCMYHEVLKDFDENFDYELSYLVDCYPDFLTTKRMNENFILTREHSLMLGNAYCDFCWHDKRLLEKVEHPERELWENL